jgi:uncharacterized membrane protein
MFQRHGRLVVLLPLLATAAPLAGEPPAVLVCRGHEPEWNLRIEGSAATLATLGTQGLAQTGLQGRLQETEWGRPPFLVYRGRAEASVADLVAVITREACLDTMADAAEGGGSSEYTARVSLPDGAIRQGCCTSIPATAPFPADEAPARPVVAAPAPATSAPASAPHPGALPTATGEIAALVLPDGQACRHTGKGARPTFRGQRVNFDCGRWGGDTVGLVGPLAVGTGGLLTAQRAVIDWRESGSAPLPIETTAVRVSEIALADGLTCRFAGKGATLAFEGRRASFTCGMKDGDTVTLLGELEPVEGGFRIVRARIAHGESGFTLRSSEPILVTAPR